MLSGRVFREIIVSFNKKRTKSSGLLRWGWGGGSVLPEKWVEGYGKRRDWVLADERVCQNTVAGQEPTVERFFMEID